IEPHVPPLRERREDVPQLVEVMLERLATDNGLAPAKLSPAAMKALCGYDFPGNVRELENILERAMAMCDDNLIGVEDLMLPGSGGRPAPGMSHDSDAPVPDPRGSGQPLDDYMSNIE